MAGKLLKGVGKLAKFAVGGLIGSSLLSKKKKAQVAAPVEKPMPLPDDEAIKNARRRALAARFSASGRTSTILTDGTTLGG